MSNEVNISEVAFGFADRGVEWEINQWNVQPQKARFFTVVASPAIILVGFPGGPWDMEITRVWSTVWQSDTGALTHQWNVRVKNVGHLDDTVYYQLLMAETDN